MTVKEQCLKIIDDKITLLYECEPSNDRSIALHWLYEVYYNINTKVIESAPIVTCTGSRPEKPNWLCDKKFHDRKSFNNINIISED